MEMTYVLFLPCRVQENSPTALSSPFSVSATGAQAHTSRMLGSLLQVYSFKFWFCGGRTSEEGDEGWNQVGRKREKSHRQPQG